MLILPSQAKTGKNRLQGGKVGGETTAPLKVWATLDYHPQGTQRARGCPSQSGWHMVSGKPAEDLTWFESLSDLLSDCFWFCVHGGRFLAQGVLRGAQKTVVEGKGFRHCRHHPCDTHPGLPHYGWKRFCFLCSLCGPELPLLHSTPWAHGLRSQNRESAGPEAWCCHSNPSWQQRETCPGHKGQRGACARLILHSPF
jgi:hypothetical protein